MTVPIIYVREGNSIVEREAPVIEHECWWCNNPFMYEVSKATYFGEEVIGYECPSCQAKEDKWGLNFMQGVGERKAK